MQQAAEAAERHGRKLAFVGTSMVENAKMARNLGYLEVPDSLIVSLDQALKMKPADVVLMCSGTQGEPSSILGRLSTGTNRSFDLRPGDTVLLSSHPIPGNEEMVHRTIPPHAEVIYDPIAPVRVRAAAQQRRWLFCSLSTNALFRSAPAREIGIESERIAVVENGTVIEFHDGEMVVGDRVPGGYVFVDGSGVGDIGPRVMREREALARDGFVVVHLSLDRQHGSIRRDPVIVSKGFVFVRDAEQLFEQARAQVRELAGRVDPSDLKDQIEQELGRFFYAETKRRPMVLVFTSEAP
jgi:ribonuclease J